LASGLWGKFRSPSHVKSQDDRNTNGRDDQRDLSNAPEPWILVINGHQRGAADYAQAACNDGAQESFEIELNQLYLAVRVCGAEEP
jgi:hypothetical protein